MPGFGGLRDGGKVGVLGGLYRGGLRYILKICGRPGIFLAGKISGKSLREKFLKKFALQKKSEKFFKQLTNPVARHSG